MRIHSNTPLGWNPTEDPLYSQYRSYSQSFQKTPSKENGDTLYRFMFGSSHEPLQTTFQSIAPYIKPSFQAEGFSFFSSAAWALHSFLQKGEDPSDAKTWLARLDQIIAR